MNLTHVRVASAIRELSERYARAGWTRSQDVHWDRPIVGALIYFCDVDSNELIALELVKGAIERLIDSDEARLPVNQVMSAFSTLLGEITSGARPFDPAARNMLSAAAALYLINSQSYRIARAQKPPLTQFLVVRYSDVSRGDHVLRVLPLMGAAGLDPLGVSDLVNHLLHIDRDGHPERFAPDIIVEFKPRTFKEFR
ncbi:MAG: hypothetical protein ABW110_21585 [Steroidobacteraceae bacterium]